MRYAAVFSVLAVALVWLAHSVIESGAWLVASVESYLAVSLLALATAYGSKHAGIAIEEVARRPQWAIPLHLLLTPYRGLAWLSLSATRVLNRDGGMSMVGPGVFVGRLPSRIERGRLADQGIEAVLNLCAEFPRPRSSSTGLVEAYVPILDGVPPSTKQFQEAVGWIIARRAEQQTVLIHCAQGHGRSATVAAVALCRLGLTSNFDEAIEQIRNARPNARPSKAQRLAAIRFLGS